MQASSLARASGFLVAEEESCLGKIGRSAFSALDWHESLPTGSEVPSQESSELLVLFLKSVQHQIVSVTSHE